jgi:plasmid maintenance system antidote protein VapI
MSNLAKLAQQLNKMRELLINFQNQINLTIVEFDESIQGAVKEIADLVKEERK